MLMRNIAGGRWMMIVASALTALPALAWADTPIPHATAGYPHQRVLPLQGGQNFRDLGGYRTMSGRTVRWGLLFRSGSMHFLTPSDYSYLEGLGIRTVCDFRSTGERNAEPVAWPAAGAPTILADDYDQDVNGRVAAAAEPPKTAAQIRERMAAVYPHLLVQFNAQYRRMFAELLAGHVPLAFNCSGGKDRSGVAAALLLIALGVPHATVVDDYLLTNRYFDPQKVVNSSNSGSRFKQMPPDMVHAYMDADRSYIEAALKVVEQHSGGAEGYFRDEMNLSRADLNTLRRLYTE